MGMSGWHDRAPPGASASPASTFYLPPLSESDPISDSVSASVSQSQDEDFSVSRSLCRCSDGSDDEASGGDGTTPGRPGDARRQSALPRPRGERRRRRRIIPKGRRGRGGSEEVGDDRRDRRVVVGGGASGTSSSTTTTAVGGGRPARFPSSSSSSSLAAKAAALIFVAAVVASRSENSAVAVAVAAAFVVAPAPLRTKFPSVPARSSRSIGGHGVGVLTAPPPRSVLGRRRSLPSLARDAATADNASSSSSASPSGSYSASTSASSASSAAAAATAEDAFRSDVVRVASRSRSPQSPSVDAAVRAEAMLDRMLEIYRGSGGDDGGHKNENEGGGGVGSLPRPDADTFAAVMRAYANVGRSRWRDRSAATTTAAASAAVGGTEPTAVRAMTCAADRAERLHVLLEELYESEGKPDDLRPTTEVRNALLRAYANCAGPNSSTSTGSDGGDDGQGEGYAERALRVVRKMEAVRDEYNAGNSDNDLDEENDDLLLAPRVPGAPDVESYASVIEAFARQQGRGAGGVGASSNSPSSAKGGDERVDPTYAALASQLLSELETSYKVLSAGDVDARSALVAAYKEVLGAWTRCGARGSARRADDILRRWEGLIMDEEDGDYDEDEDEEEDFVEDEEEENGENWVDEGSVFSEDSADGIMAGRARAGTDDGDNVEESSTTTPSGRTDDGGDSNNSDGGGVWRELDADFDRRFSRVDFSSPYYYGDDDNLGSYDFEGDSEFDEQTTTLLPTASTYTSLILAHSQSREPGSALRANDLLEQCCVTYESGAWDHLPSSGAGDGDGGVYGIYSEYDCDADRRPDPVAFNAVISAWGRSPSPEGAERAEAVLEMMEWGLREEFPADRKYGHAYDDEGDGSEGEARERVAGIYDYLVPNAVSYNSAIAAWVGRASSAKPDDDETWVAAMGRAEALLRRMEEQEDEEFSKRRTNNVPSSVVKPDAYTYSTLLHGYARRRGGGGSAADDAERHLRSMEDRYLDGDERCKPDVRAYSAVVAAHGRTGTHEGAERALAVLRRMEDLAAKAAADSDVSSNADRNAGGKRRNSLEPDAVLYTSVIDAFAKSRHPDGGRVALELLDELTARWEARVAATRSASASSSGGDDDADRIVARAAARALLPTSRTYCSVLSALASCRSEGNAQGARDVLRRMNDAYDAAEDDEERALLRPTARAYNHVINACANTLGRVEREKRDAFKVALATFVELRRRGGESNHAMKVQKGQQRDASPVLRPDGYTYAFFLKACCALLPLGPARTDVMVRTFRECREGGMLTDEALDRIKRGMTPGEVRDLLGKGRNSGGERDYYRNVRVRDLPEEWSRNAAAAAAAAATGGRSRAREVAISSGRRGNAGDRRQRRAWKEDSERSS